MKGKIITWVESPENSFPGSDGIVKATALTIDVNGQSLTYITFAKKFEVGEEIDYELKNDKQGNQRLKIIRPQSDNYSKGGGKTPEIAKLELLGRACNQAAQLATKDGAFNSVEADKILAWIKLQLNATQQPVQQPQAQQTGQLPSQAPVQDESDDLPF